MMRMCLAPTCVGCAAMRLRSASAFASSSAWRIGASTARPPPTQLGDELSAPQPASAGAAAAPPNKMTSREPTRAAHCPCRRHFGKGRLLARQTGYARRMLGWHPASGAAFVLALGVASVACSPETRTFNPEGTGGAASSSHSSSSSAHGGSPTSSHSGTTATTGGGGSGGAGCQPETDAEYSAMIDGACGPITANDNCGTSRAFDCGSCSNGKGCVGSVCRTPVCANLAIDPATQALDATVNTAAQDAFHAITPDGATMLVLTSTSCGAFVANLYDAATATLLAAPHITNMTTDEEEQVTLTPDGLTLIATNSGHTRFNESSRSAAGVVDFGPAQFGHFSNIVVVSPQVLSGPAISPDQLAFYYTLSGDPDPMVDGMYESVRASTTAKFPVGARLPDVVQGDPAAPNSYVTGTSSDRLALFVQTGSFSMLMFTRNAPDAAWTNPNDPNPPPALIGFRARPLANCKTWFYTCTTAGCTGEDVCSATSP